MKVNFGVVMCAGVINNKPVNAVCFGLLTTATLGDVLLKISQDDDVIQTIQKIQVNEQKPVFFGVRIAIDGVEFPIIAAKPSKEVSKQMLFNAIHALTVAFFDELASETISGSTKEISPISDEEIAAIALEFLTDGQGN